MVYSDIHLHASYLHRAMLFKYSVQWKDIELLLVTKTIIKWFLEAETLNINTSMGNKNVFDVWSAKMTKTKSEIKPYRTYRKKTTNKNKSM